MNKGLVSIITPCYNVEKVVHKYLNSILNQTYKKIELILINDGSTDKTEKVILSHKGLFKSQGIIFKYIYQDNRGLGGAINTGLKHFTGEYLCWPDPDDILNPDSVKKRIDFLERNVEYACVTSDANMYYEHDLIKPIKRISSIYENNTDENQFLYLLLGKSIFCSGCHMIRSSMFLDVNPNREIFEARRGQNWQMLLPVYYKYKRGFINEPLYNYIIYKNSMSSGDDTKEKKIIRENGCLEIIKNTLETMNISDKDKYYYYNIYWSYCIKRVFFIAIDFRDIKLALNCYILALKKKVKIESSLILLLKMMIKSIVINKITDNRYGR